LNGLIIYNNKESSQNLTLLSAMNLKFFLLWILLLEVEVTIIILFPLNHLFFILTKGFFTIIRLLDLQNLFIIFKLFIHLINNPTNFSNPDSKIRLNFIKKLKIDLNFLDFWIGLKYLNS
jgi:hypothetical protein